VSLPARAACPVKANPHTMLVVMTVAAILMLSFRFLSAAELRESAVSISFLLPLLKSLALFWTD
jgi:hypothetical protein